MALPLAARSPRVRWDTTSNSTVPDLARGAVGDCLRFVILTTPVFSGDQTITHAGLGVITITQGRSSREARRAVNPSRARPAARSTQARARPTRRAAPRVLE